MRILDTAGTVPRDWRPRPDDRANLPRSTAGNAVTCCSAYCLGAALARMELRLALPPLLDHLSDSTIDQTHVTWKRSFLLRGPVALPTIIGAR